MPRRPLIALLLLATGCVGTPSPARLQRFTSVAVIARVADGAIRSELCEDDAIRARLAPKLDEAEADAKIGERLRKAESGLELETRFSGGVIEAFGERPPFVIASPTQVAAATGSLLAREAESHVDPRALARGGLDGLLDVEVLALELLPPGGGHSSGLRLHVRATLSELPDESALWRREFELVPEKGSALEISPEEFEKDPEAVWRRALGAAATSAAQAIAQPLSGAK